MTCQNIHRQNFWLAVNTIRGREARIMQREKTLEYFLKSKEKLWFIHPQTNKELEALLRILNDHGEEKLLHYIKYRYLKGETRKIRY